MLKWFCQKNTKLRPTILIVLMLKVVKSLSMKVFAATISSYGVSSLWSEERIEAFWVSNGQIKIRMKPECAVS